MNKNLEVEAAHIIWKKLCEFESLLFDYYGNEFIDIHMDEEDRKIEEGMDWPF